MGLIEEHAPIRFERMPALLWIILDAHWKVIECATLASIEFVIYVQIKMEVENAKRAPCLMKLRHVVDVLGKVEALGVYWRHAERLYGLGVQGLLSRMVPSE